MHNKSLLISKYANNLFKKNRICKIFNIFLEWIIVVYCVESTAGIHFYKVDSVISKHNNIFLFLFYCIVLLWIVINGSGKIKVDTQMIVTAFCIIGSVIMTLFSSYKNIKYSLMRVYIPITCGIIMMFFVQDVSQIFNILKKFIILMTAIGIISFAFWLFASFFEHIKATAIVSYDWGEERIAQSYYNIYYESDWQKFTILGRPMYKNCGIFAEPPMYGYLLCLSYFFSRMINKGKGRILIPAALLVTIISSFSVTAIISIMIFETIIFGCKKSTSHLQTLLKVFALFVTIISVIVFGTGLVSDKLDSASGGTRLDHLRVSLNLFQSHLITGVGFGNDAIFEQYEKYKQGMSIGMPAVWAQGGIGGFVLTILPLLILLLHSINNKCWIRFALSVSLIWILTCTMVYFVSPITWIMTIYLCQGNKSKSQISILAQ